MAQESVRSLQNTFVAHVQEHSVSVTVFLVNGVKLRGYVTRFDKFGVTLTRVRQTQLIYKRAISAINPLTAIELFSQSDESTR